MSTSKRAVLTTVFKLEEGQDVRIGRFDMHRVGESFELGEDGKRLTLYQIAVELLADE